MTTPAPITKAELKKLLFAQCEQSGGVRAFATKKNLSPSLVSASLSGERNFSPSVANAMGFVFQEMAVQVRG